MFTCKKLQGNDDILSFLFSPLLASCQKLVDSSMGFLPLSLSSTFQLDPAAISVQPPSSR